MVIFRLEYPLCLRCTRALVVMIQTRTHHLSGNVHYIEQWTSQQVIMTYGNTSTKVNLTCVNKLYVSYLSQYTLHPYFWTIIPRFNYYKPCSTNFTRYILNSNEEQIIITYRVSLPQSICGICTPSGGAEVTYEK